MKGVEYRSIKNYEKYSFYIFLRYLEGEQKMLETDFQGALIKKLEKIFPGCFVFKTDPVQHQGIPDLLILWNDRWAFLECKRSKDEAFRPNQEYYIEIFDAMSFASVIFPDNEQEVLRELQCAFKS